MERTKDKHGRGQPDVKVDTSAIENDWAKKMMDQMLVIDEIRFNKREVHYPSGIRDNLTLEGICECIKRGECKKILVMTGPGISEAMAFPDFEMDESHPLYRKLKEAAERKELNVPQDFPISALDLSYFSNNPEPFYKLIYPDLYPNNNIKPTDCHYFIRLLQDKNLLLRHYTQNTDGLEREVGIREDLLVEAHGHFRSGHCLKCHWKYDGREIYDLVLREEIPYCKESCKQSANMASSQDTGGNECRGLIKPDIIFTNEELPERFFELAPKDMKNCDMLIIIGTPLTLQPFASLFERVSEHVPRLYINPEEPANGEDLMSIIMGIEGHGLKFMRRERKEYSEWLEEDEENTEQEQNEEQQREDNMRDVLKKEDCKLACMRMIEELGWKNDLDELKLSTGRNEPDLKS